MSHQKTKMIIITVSSVAGVCSLLFASGLLQTEGPREPAKPPHWAEVKRVVSGHKVKLKGGERLLYAGIRCPYPHEPLHQEAYQRNVALVDGREVRLRFDEQKRDREERLLGYASVDNQLVNETLVREGLAYVRLTPGTRRFANKLLAAQTDARREKRGLWRERRRSARGGYHADPKYGNFHLPSCEKAKNIKPDRLLVIQQRAEAFETGFAPCAQCQP